MKQRPHQAGELRHHVAHAPVGADVFDASQPFPQKTEQLGVGLARVPPRSGRRSLHLAQEQRGQRDVGRAHQANAPILYEQHGQGAQHQQAVAQQSQR